MDRDLSDGTAPGDASDDGLSELATAGAAWRDESKKLREELLTRTTRVVRRRRRLRHGGLAASFVAVYLIGLWCGRLGVQSAEPTPASETEASRVRADSELLLQGGVLAQVANAPAQEKLRLLRLAGDNYLADGHDVRGALRCYRQWMELAPPALRSQADPEDSWLLLALKEGQRF